VERTGRKNDPKPEALMFLPAILFLSLAAQQPTQQPAAAPAKPAANASQQADTSKTKHKARRTARKAKPASTTPAPRDTTKKP